MRETAKSPVLILLINITLPCSNDQSPGLLQILGKHSCLFILILWLYPVLMEVLRFVKSDTGKISLWPHVKIAQSPISQTWGPLQSPRRTPILKPSSYSTIQVAWITKSAMDSRRIPAIPALYGLFMPLIVLRKLLWKVGGYKTLYHIFIFKVGKYMILTEKKMGNSNPCTKTL